MQFVVQIVPYFTCWVRICLFPYPISCLTLSIQGFKFKTINYSPWQWHDIKFLFLLVCDVQVNCKFKSFLCFNQLYHCNICCSLLEHYPCHYFYHGSFNRVKLTQTIHFFFLMKGQELGKSKFWYGEKLVLEISGWKAFP